MGQILGLVGSARSWGNSELLTRQILQGAQSQGAAVGIVRLTDLHLESCTGCLRCAIGGGPCPIEDDMKWLIETVEAADGLVLAAPTYFLGPAAVIKLILDRLLMVVGRIDRPLPTRRPAVTVASAGLEGWRGVTLPYLNALVAAFGYQPIDSLVAIAPGPGEVLLDEPLMARALSLGKRLGRGELDPEAAPPNVCPVCRSDAFVLQGDRAVCPICGCQATIDQTPEGVRLEFQPTPEGGQRWTPEGLRTHIVDWVMATGPRFQAHRAEIKARREPFRGAELPWLCPPR